MINFTPELLLKAKTAKNVEALLELAKNEAIEMTAEEAKECFIQLHPPVGEIDDDDLDNVSGGCSDSTPSAPADYGYPNGTHVYAYNLRCPRCGENGYHNPSVNYTLTWVDKAGGRYRLTCRVCGGVTEGERFSGNPKDKGFFPT